MSDYHYSNRTQAQEEASDSVFGHNHRVTLDSQAKWEERYAAQAPRRSEDACRFLQENRDRLPRTGLVCDLASGKGRNALFLARQGLEVVAIDFALGALKSCRDQACRANLPVHCVAADLTNYPIPRRAFDCIVNVNYLQRDLVPGIVGGLKPGGLLLFETMMTEQLRFTPRFNRDYLLQPGELLRMFRGLHLLSYREVILGTDSGNHDSLRAVASLVACRDS